MYRQFIEQLEDTDSKRIMLAFLQRYTAPFSPLTLAIRKNHKLVNVPADKLAAAQSNDKFKIAYSHNDNRIYILDVNTKIETLQIYLQHFEDIAKDVYLTNIQHERKITPETKAVYFKPL